ncbi:helix-turn-helix domain-containing protein [Oceanihabitans sp. IOP_32]|uniref:helix-turn-helix domain-containing protein n=1 Tax=Oceanihabitans sp. IOP_32 TaxID=2529032 RepID=UPI0012939F24|nr:helix-turn-helix domain-containing protein [Oceanihabitans sp. IOP_32]QFZ54626.1 helix-turn-helix domain-containing protein [Oceanihabitans sp. IOP_32]
MYQEIKPSKGIDNLIDSFWAFSNNKSSENFKVLPDTCVDLIFDLNQNKGFLSGIMTNYQYRELATESDLIGVRFKSEKFGFLSKIPLYQTKNLRLELAEIFPTQNLKVLNQLTDIEKLTDKISFLENFVATSFKQDVESQDQIILTVAEKIRTLQGIVNVGDLAKLHHISLRQLERRFKSYIGVTVKEFSNIVRFNNTKNSIATFTKTSLLEIAFDMGFFDHSHMTYEFKRISGENPSFFR